MVKLTTKIFEDTDSGHNRAEKILLEEMYGSIGKAPEEIEDSGENKEDSVNQLGHVIKNVIDKTGSPVEGEISCRKCSDANVSQVDYTFFGKSLKTEEKLGGKTGYKVAYRKLERACHPYRVRHNRKKIIVSKE